MKTHQYPNLNETIYEDSLDGDLNVILIHKPDFAKTFVTLTAPLGAIHRGFIDENDQIHQAPSGLAHFLEHKIFEDKSRDISKDFSLDEASINAFTEHHQTTYLFNATNHIEKNIKRLLKMFFYPTFTEAGVQKEKGIIKEELNMHLDDPYYLQYKTLVNNLYHYHPIKDDILGTEESIQNMDVSMLKAMHQAYYQPNKSQLIIIGPTSPKPLFKALKSFKLPKNKAVKPYAFDKNKEPKHVVKALEELSLDVQMPSVLLGVKLNIDKQEDVLSRRQEKLALSMLFDILFGKGSDIYETWLNEGIINDSYGLDIAYEKDFAYLLIGSESLKPKAFLSALKQALLSIDDMQIDQADLLRIKKGMHGSFLQGLDAMENLAYQFSDTLMDHFMYYDTPKILQAIDIEKLNQQKNHIKESAISAVIGHSKQH